MNQDLKTYLQNDGECFSHHLNGPERIHNVFQLVLSENPIRCKPETQKQDVRICISQTHRVLYICIHIHTLAQGGIYEALLECRSSR